MFSKERWGKLVSLLVPQSVSVGEGGMGDAPPGLGMMGVPGGPPPPGGPWEPMEREGFNFFFSQKSDML